jgi:subtilisin family serine protease
MQRALVTFNIVLLLCVGAQCITYNVKNSEANIETPKKSPPKRNPERFKVAVIDTGLDSSMMEESWVCRSGHKDFTGSGLHDRHGHGTHISGLIDQYAKDFIFGPNKNNRYISSVDTEYCQIIIKYYDPIAPGNNNLTNTIKAFRWAIDQGAHIINYSGGGLEPSESERRLVLEALNKGIKVVVAAGNEKSDIDKKPYYPAMYDKRMYVVGNKTREGDVSGQSNYGDSVNTWEEGDSVYSRLPGQSFGLMTGTSQATAIKSGKLVREMLRSK